MEWLSDLTDIVEGLVAWITLSDWAIRGAIKLADLLQDKLRRRGRRLK